MDNDNGIDPRVVLNSYRHQVFSNHSLCQELVLLGETECQEKLKLCGFPSFCSAEAYDSCLTTSLKECDECNIAYFAILVTVYVVLGLFILLGNGVVIWNVFSKRKGFEDTYSKIRASLAFADILTGVQIFVVILYNLNWTLEVSSFEIDSHEVLLEGSIKATIGGVIYLLSFTASLYHLVFLSSQRLYAIALPFHYKARSKYWFRIGLALVWIFALLSAVFPVWFPGTLTFSYRPISFLYFPTISSGEVEVSYQAAIATLVVLLVIPYFLITVLSIISAVLIVVYCKKRLHKLTASQVGKSRSNKMTKYELKVLKTVVLMQIGFIVTMMPLIVVSCMFYSGLLDCDSISTPYLITIILSISNSLMNVIIYSVLDLKFRSSIVDILRFWFRLCMKSKKNAKRTITNSNNLTSTQLSGSGVIKAITQSKCNIPISRESSGNTPSTKIASAPP